MAGLKTVTYSLKYLSTVLQDKQISDEFIKVYTHLLEDIPDDVIISATFECLKTCRFFPTIAELREKSQPFWQQYNAKNQRALESNALSKCQSNVSWDEKNYPTCELEKNSELCCLAKTGMCGKWEVKKILTNN